MQGGADYGIDTCWYNPGGEVKPNAMSITYEIQALPELIELLA
jgi:2-haloacid dehalogenase